MLKVLINFYIKLFIVIDTWMTYKIIYLSFVHIIFHIWGLFCLEKDISYIILYDSYNGIISCSRLESRGWDFMFEAISKASSESVIVDYTDGQLWLLYIPVLEHECEESTNSFSNNEHGRFLRILLSII